MFRSPFEQQNKVMAMAIPLYMQKKRDEENLAYKEQILTMKRQELAGEATKRAEDLKAKAAESKVKYLTDMYKSAVEKGDPNLAKSFGTQLQSLGLPVATQQTEGPPLKWLVNQKTDKPVTSIEQLIANTPNMTTEQKINLFKTTKKENPSFKTFYDTSGTPHTIDTTRQTPDSSWSEGRPEKETALQQKINEIRLAYPGMDDKKARRIATGSLKVVSDPVTGNFAVVDVGTNEQINLKAEGETETKPKEYEGKTLWELSDLATGPVSAAMSAASIPSGVVGGPVAEKTVYARQFLQSSQNELIRALSINPRFPVGEINRLKEEVNISPKFWDNPGMLRTRMKAVNDYLTRRLEKERSASKDTNLPKDTRQNALAAAKDIENFVNTMGVPEEKPGGITKDDEGLINKYLKGSK
uniref:Uncharacterized protein n=1 Tax=viral metagenome TaxID=1070528 RepID=A0A6H1ZLG0_9ZZZZ